MIHFVKLNLRDPLLATAHRPPRHTRRFAKTKRTSRKRIRVVANEKRILLDVVVLLEEPYGRGGGGSWKSVEGQEREAKGEGRRR